VTGRLSSAAVRRIREFALDVVVEQVGTALSEISREPGPAGRLARMVVGAIADEVSAQGGSVAVQGKIIEPRPRTRPRKRRNHAKKTG